MAERNSKRQKLEEDVDAKLEAFVSVQEQINEQDNELAEKMLELTREYAAKKAPLYTQRQSVSEAIPNFWSKVLLAWQPIEDILTDEDDEALKHLTGIMVEEREDPQEYKLCFSFSSNPYFTDSVLWKVISTGTREQNDEEDDEPALFEMGASVVEASGIHWKDTPKARALRAKVDDAVGEKNEDEDNEDDSSRSFFMLFHPNDRNADIADGIRTEVFQDPTVLYNESDGIEEDDV